MLNKSNILYYFTFILLGLLGFRLFQLQVIEYNKYKVLAKNNSTRTSITRAPRGIIYDRNNEILATSKQSLSVIVYPAALRTDQEKAMVAKRLSNFISSSYEELLKLFSEMEPTTPLPITLDNDITVESAIKIFENQDSLPGIAVEKQATRYYPHNEATAHLLGFVGQINNDELKQGRSRGLGLGDIIGKDGLEKVYDENLQGINGEARVSVDRYGRSLQEGPIGKKIIKDAIKGSDMHLTIDIDLQKVAYEALKHMAGAAIVLNPKNGEIYALVSTPSFDPNIFTKPVPPSVYNELMQKKAFINRAISAYPPGSIWKPITSLAALEHGVANESEILHVSGSVYFGGFRFGDWTSKEDSMNIVEALAWSRNTFFYQIAKRMQPEWIANTGRKFGAGSKTGVELFGEAAGVVPDPEWKKKYAKEPWFPGNTLHLAIGQSFLMLTPIQAAKVISGIANKGYSPQLHLIKNPGKERLIPIDGFSEKTYDIVRKGLERCVDTGTGQASKFTEFKVAGKTGSAEVKGYAHTTHGWFASYAPADNPEIVVAVFAEGAGHGGSVAAPVAKKIYEAWYAKKIGKEIPKPEVPSEEKQTAQ